MYGVEVGQWRAYSTELYKVIEIDEGTHLVTTWWPMTTDSQKIHRYTVRSVAEDRLASDLEVTDSLLAHGDIP